VRGVSSGVQGLADTFILCRMAFDSDAAKVLNTEIFETIYFAALTASKDLSKVHGPYTSYPGSPVSKGVLQYDMWGVTPSARWNWSGLKVINHSSLLICLCEELIASRMFAGTQDEIKQHGVRNSLLLAPMPTASTSQILGNNECIEPYTSNLYVRRTLAGEFVCVSRHLLKDLIDLKMWTPVCCMLYHCLCVCWEFDMFSLFFSQTMKNKLIAANGSVQGIMEIPQHIRELYKTVWEISQKRLVDMAVDRGAYIDQSQSFNVVRMNAPCLQFHSSTVVDRLLVSLYSMQHMTNLNFGKMTSLHFHAWRTGLKTGMYYLRSKSAADAIKFTLDHDLLKQAKAVPETAIVAERIPAPAPLQRSITATSESAMSFASSTTAPDISVESTQDDAERIRKEREEQREAMMCSLENKEACLSCGS